MNMNLQHLFLATLSLSLLGCKQASINTPPPIDKPIQVIEVQATKNRSLKHFNGTVLSQKKAGLSFRVPGMVENILVKQGDSVVKGQVLAYLDRHDYQVTLEELKARKLEAESAHKLAKAELERVKQATADNAIASVNLDRAISGYERSLSAINVVNKNIQRAHDALSYTELKAPFDGVVGRVNFDAYEQILPGVNVIDIQDLTQLEVEIDVPETLINQFHIGQSSQVSWHQAERQLAATVSEISTFPNILKQTYSVTLTIEELDDALLPGRSVTVSSRLGNEQPVYCLPYSALIGEHNDLKVNLVREKRIIRQPVQMRTLDAHSACVSSHFNADDLVVISGSPYVIEGDAATNLIVKTQ